MREHISMINENINRALPARAPLIVIAVLLGYCCILFMSVVSYFSFNIFPTEIVVFKYDRWISLLSLAYFTVLMITGFGSIRRFCFLTPLAIMTVPNAINSYFPSIFLGPLTDSTNATFPFITHIDLFLILGIVNLYVTKNYPKQGKSQFDWLVLLLVVFFLAGVFYKFFLTGDVTRYLNNAFHIRYLALVYILHTYFANARNRESFLRGVLFAAPILLLECIVTTITGGHNIFGSFSSGNFANNVLGHFLVFITLLLYFARNKEYRSSMMTDLVIALVFLGMLLTGVRGAYLSFVLCFVASYMFRTFSFKNAIAVCATLFIGLAVLISSYIDLAYWGDFFYSVTYIYQNGFDANAIKIDPTVTSIFTRVALWIGTAQMYLDNFVFGVGFAQWNILKSAYGIPFNMLLDPHNDYLFYLVSYGSVIGFGFLWMIYLSPIIHILKTARDKVVLNPYYHALLGFCFSGLTNANTSKHQVFAFIIIITFFAVFYEQNEERRSL